MELKWLEDFEMLANTLSFSRAAEARHVTQSAFSRRIRQLETWLGAPLINRATVPAELTREGRAFLPVAQEAIRAFYAARDALRPQIADHAQVTFAALHTLTVTFFPGWLDRLTASVPDLRSAIIPDRGGIEANLGALTEGEADLFLTYAHPTVPFILDPQRFDHLVLGTERVLPVAGVEVRTSCGASLPGEALLDRTIAAGERMPYLCYGESSFFGVALGRLFGKRPDLLRDTVHQNTICTGLRTLALAGRGVCWLPETLVTDDLSAGRLRLASTDPAWTMEVQIRLYRPATLRRPIVERIWRTVAGGLDQSLP